jgi:glyoxylase-like metal-dependent hydrolase (beta-lactamase superfamily II)
VFGDSVKPIADAGKADLVASDASLTDEITLIPTPGHSPGHMSVHIKSNGEEALLTGDAAHHPCQMTHLDWSSTADSDPRQSVVSRRELFSRFADTPTAGDRRALRWPVASGATAMPSGFVALP